MQPSLTISDQVGLLFERFEQPRPSVRTEPSELHVGDYHASVQERLLGLFAAEGAQALMDACNVIQALESLDCTELRMPALGDGAFLVIDGVRASRDRFRVAVARAAWPLGRRTLARLLAPQMGLHRSRLPAAPSEARPAPAATGEMTLSGDCRQIPLTDLLQMLARNGRTGVVRLKLEGGELGSCSLREGELVHAVCHGYRGEEALVELLAVPNATFTFTRESTAERTIYRKAAAVIMDTLRLLDERAAG